MSMIYNSINHLPLTSTTKDMETIFSSPLKVDKPIYCAAVTVHMVPFTYKMSLDFFFITFTAKTVKSTHKAFNKSGSAT